jgi:hypothetical protein
MTYKIVQFTLAAGVANAASVNVPYPTDTDAGTFKGAFGHRMNVDGGALLNSPADFTLAFNSGSIAVTNLSGVAWAAGQKLYIEAQQVGTDYLAGVKRTILAALAYVNIGAPIAASAAGIAAAQTPTVAGNLALAAIALDVPRNITETGVAGTVAHTLTVTGKDEYGNTLIETITGAVGATTVAGKKAFKYITSIAVSGGTTAAISVGWGNALGLPFFLQDNDFLLKEMQDDAPAVAGVFANGDQTKPSAVTGDVRGTYTPNAAADGLKAFRLVVTVTDPTYLGLAQFAG